MKKIVLFGDSIFAGYSDGKMTDALTDRISKHFPDDKVINLSIPGYKTSNAVSNIQQNILELHPDLLILGFGANDISTNDEIKPGKFASNLATIIDAVGKDKIVLLSPPYTDWHKVPSRPWTRQLQFDLVTEHIGKESDIAYIDLLHEMSNSNSVQKLLQTDGLHFTSKGYNLLEELLVPQIKLTLAKQSELVSN
ncbi:SGNH/GDSL hydrolase family protein [Companilactobacillus kedongensis]|uniref:SGNH/GDSL hydrolase family protein n=1 Tax=Companilactobacillus kedongensis TaxID=2486004 RepID=UPI000F7AD528|nr:GDSL-type esterase/lipase family protein [Companilactobacillus kedongensis]